LYDYSPLNLLKNKFLIMESKNLKQEVAKYPDFEILGNGKVYLLRSAVNPYRFIAK
jgi:hypothetical protein